MKNYCRLLALVLSFAIIFTALPVLPSVAEPSAQETVYATDDTDITQTQTQVSGESYPLYEIIEKRESDTKHFRMSDGSITAAVYPYDVHFKNSEGEFLDIDNSLASENDGNDKVLSNQNNETFVKFMKKSNPNKLYTINKGEHKIKVSIEGVSKVEATEESSTGDILTDSKYQLKNIGSKITYTDILDNTDIEFTLISTELKENIILKEKVDFNSLVYTYHLNNSLDAVQKDSKNIEVFDKDANFIFNISAPVMWDSEGNYFDDLTLEILEEKNSKIKVKLVWKAPESAQYPVTIDPVMSFCIDRNNIQDTHIISAYPTTNYDANNHIRIRNNGYAMLKFPTPSLNSGDKIINAQLVLTPYGAFDNSLSIYTNENSYNPPLYITAHKILRSWSETTATYTNVNPDNGFYDSTVQSYRVVDGDGSQYAWDITRLVNEWTEGYASNYGILLKYAAAPSDGSMFDSFFCSTNGAYIASYAWPQMIYQYVNTTGIEDYFSYHTQSIGYAGTGYTNDLSGNLTLVNNVFTTGGSLMPISVSLVYNTRNVTTTHMPYGRGWHLNWAQKIDWSVKSNYNSTQYAKYTDGDGTAHFFELDASTKNGTDEINPDRKIYFINSTGDYKMTDSSGTCMYFKRNGTLNKWYLYKVEDIYGNYIQITLNSSDLNRVERVESSTGSVVDFVYSQFGFLTQIKYYDEGAEKIIRIGYNKYVTTHNNCVSDITYPDNTAVQYHYYDTTKYLSKAVDIGGQSIVYNYKWTTPMRVNYVAEQSSTSEIGNEMSMTYQSTATVFNDVTNNRKYLYTFAQNGTLKSAVDITANDGNGYGQYYEYNNGITTETTGTGNLTFISKTQKSTVNLIKNHSFESSTNLPTFQVWNETIGTSTGGVSTSKSNIGSYSYKLYRHEQSNSSCVLGFYSVNLTGGVTYTLSAYVNTSQMVSTGKGASVLAICSDFRTESQYVTETSDTWQRISVTFTPSVSEYVSICMTLSGATGSVYFDNIQLEVGDLSEYNLLENAGFERDTSTTPDGWYASAAKGTISTSVYASGAHSLKFEGGTSKHIHVYQPVKVPNGKNGDVYVISAFAKATSVPAMGYRYSVMVRFIKSGSIVNEQNILFNSYTTEWQKVSGAAKATGDYDTIQFWLLYYNNCNTVYFDNAQLVKDTFGTTYTYDSNGNLISTIDLQGQEEYTFKYNSNNQLIKETNISGSKIFYTYNSSKKQQLDLVSAGGNSTYYDYDSHGNAVTTSTYGSGLTDGTYYYVQNVYYSKYFNVVNSGTTSGTAVIIEDLKQNSAQRWKLIKNTDGSYSMSPECAPSMLLSVKGSTLSNANTLALYPSGAQSYQKFNLVKQSGNVYYFDITGSTNYSVECSESYIYSHTMHHGQLQQFVLIPARGNHTAQYPAIISTATYTENGEYTSSVTDSRGNTVSYEYNEDRGYLKSQTAPNGVTTNYTYNLSELLEKVSVNNGESTSQVSYAYNIAKQLSSIVSPSGTAYALTYDNFGRNTAISVGSTQLSNHIYNSKGLLDTTTYANGTSITYTYDNLNRQTGITINNELRYKFVYDGSSRVIEVIDLALSKKLKYDYDILGRAVCERLIDTATNTVMTSLNIRYDDTKNRVSGYDINIEGISSATDYVYGENNVDPDTVTSVKHNGTKVLSYSYDELGRLKSQTLNTTTPFVTQYGYLQGATANNTTTLVNSIINGDTTLSYTYDTVGNITSVSENGTLIESYTYDNLNQLVSVTRGEDVYTYSYDNGGNILTVKLNGETVKSYTYADSEWKDLLTAFNGQTITYDAIGNPLNYRDGYVFTWADGRKLSTVTNGTNSYSYTYNSDGLRASKTVNGVKTDYYWIDGVLQAQKTGSEYIIFLYDESGNAYGFLLKNGTTEEYYYYTFNIQGDITGIVDSSGALVVQYTYSAWGELLSITGALKDTIGIKNPLRYRGYYYDTETGFYYLQSRYYDPVVQRFVNADGVVAGAGTSVHGYNLFSYAFNNPINMDDVEGNWPKWIKEIRQVINNLKNRKKVIQNKPGIIMYDVPVYKQEDSNLCWSACEVMIESWNSGNILSQEDSVARMREIAREKFGVIYDQPNSPRNMIEDIYYRPRIFFYDMTIYYALKKGPIYAFYHDGNQGHYVVVTGINLFKGEVYTNNPWGMQGTQTINEFKKGFYGMRGYNMKLDYINPVHY